MKHAALILTLALAGCMGVETDCRWDGLTDAECTEGNAGDGVASAPDASESAEIGTAPEPTAKPSRSTPAPREASTAPVSRPERPSVPDKPAPAPEPEKPDYAGWSQPGDDALFDGYSEAEVREKKDFLARARQEAEAAAKAEQSGGFNR